MKQLLNSKRSLILWQVLFISLGTSWLWAPQLNHLLSYRTALISQYEIISQPYFWLFKLGDLLAAGLLLLIAKRFTGGLSSQRFYSYLLLIIGVGMLTDPLLTTTCHVSGDSCREYWSLPFLAHAIETVVTSAAVFAIATYDYLRRKRLVSATFVIFQISYGCLFLSQLADHENFNTFAQFIYQTAIVVWLAWFCYDILSPTSSKNYRRTVVRRGIAVWAFLNGLLAILISQSHLQLFGRLHGLYFAGDNAWLAQHGVVIGVVMLYLSRHLVRGEMRARQIMLFISGIEVLKYSAITPNAALLAVYIITFIGLFVLRDDFGRGALVASLKIRLKDVLFMVVSLVLASILALAVLYRSHHLSDITNQSIDHFLDYSVRSQVVSHTHVKSALLAHTMSAFLLASFGVILWILFRPYRPVSNNGQDYARVEALLNRYSKSSEDYFKLWPADKQFFWAADGGGFVAYKISGPIAFALADPIAPPGQEKSLLGEFTAWAQTHRLSTCFLPVYGGSLKMYKATGMDIQQIGASAVVQINKFLESTAKNKWWRWKTNRATKSGYKYNFSVAPHAPELMVELQRVSNEWLSRGGHQERGFSLGYFNQEYISKCHLHYLIGNDGRVAAFTNQLPSFGAIDTATVDLIRYVPAEKDTMPYLFLKTIENVKQQGGFAKFDLGFVPFAATKDPIISVVRALSTGRFSARGLEQFKNKFDPDWQPNYLAYDGDIADLTLIALNIEKVTSRQE